MSLFRSLDINKQAIPRYFYKIYSRNEKGRYYSLYNHHHHSNGYYDFNIVYRQKKTFKLKTQNNKEYYDLGYHAFAKFQDAYDYAHSLHWLGLSIVLVKLDNIHFCGETLHWQKVFVGKKITLMAEILKVS